jgi:hypothetical protein
MGDIGDCVGALMPGIKMLKVDDVYGRDARSEEGDMVVLNGLRAPCYGGDLSEAGGSLFQEGPELRGAGEVPTDQKVRAPDHVHENEGDERFASEFGW